MPVTEMDSNAEILMPTPHSYAPAPGARHGSAVDFAAENLRMLIDLWIAKRPTRRGLPALGHFDSLELRAWLDNLIILNVERTVLGSPGYRYHSIGPAASAVEGGDYCGLYLSEALSPAQSAPRILLYDRVVRTRAPAEVHCRTEMADRTIAKWDAVALPLSHDQGQTDHLMVLTYVAPATR
ncbi:MAG: hypothetical protein P1U88_08610 [Thalassobaculaceae bacterium]|nr:hypothetical protein [Thalassobaculaceae bacterium]